MLTWKMITDDLDKEKYKVITEKVPEREYIGLQAMFPETSQCMKEYLYMVKPSVTKFKELPEETSLLLIYEPGYMDLRDLEKYKAISNCLIITEEEYISIVLEHIHHLFYVQSKANELLLRMLEASRDNCGIQKLVNMLAEEMCVPIDIMSTSLQFVVTSERSWDVNDTRERFARPGGYLPADFMKEFKDTGKLKELIDVKDCTMITHPLYASWFVPLIVKGVKVGFLIAFDAPEDKDRTIKKEYLPYFSKFADIICIELCKTNYAVKNKANYYSYIFASLLDGKTTDVEEVKQLLDIYGYTLQQKLYLAAIEKENLMMSEQGMLATAEFLKDMFYNSIYTEKGNRLYFLISRTCNQMITTDELELWNQYMITNCMYGSITDVFYDFKEMKTRCEEVDLLIEHEKRNKTYGLSFFPECQIKTLMEQLRQTGSLKHYCYPPVMRLKLYDEKHGSDLVETLRVYLENPKDIERICNQLYIHKNTLYKRLDKIKTVMGREFTSAEEIMRIQLTFHLLNAIKE